MDDLRQLIGIHTFCRDGVAFDRLIGFQDLGGVDDFPTSRLENWLLRKG